MTTYPPNDNRMAETGPGGTDPPVEELGERLDLAHAETSELTWADVGARSQQLIRTSLGLGVDVAVLSVRTASRLFTIASGR